MKIWLNGSIVDGGEAVISVYDHGFLYGLGLFETFRTYGGKPYLLERHLDRLCGGCRELGIPFAMKADELRREIASLLAANELADGYIRLTVSAGVGELGLPAGDYNAPTVLILAKSLPPAGADALRRGRELRLLRTRRNSPEGTVRFKSLHYMNNIIAKREMLGLMQEREQQSFHLQQQVVQIASLPSPGAEGLMLSRDGWLTEGIVSNLFFLRQGVIYTPCIETGILPGVTRARVIELARDTGYEVEEGLYTWEQLLEAEEVWLTNSIQELVPVTRLSDWDGLERKVGIGEAGALTLELLDMYRSDTEAATL
ncbi:4-amino-4-deoxychorismate lyase [Paenibacillus sp. MY03]|uniref:aminotransferase class IV n=1 Tax=Paenibacillus sp. MY03 TaxID=302980 RepID=UPI000B3C0293|nr:aminotransferase class IV [Paenibacillus sp. MY03]OUS69932.1 4-amino-4-deoxychorismate lyase [Paenibacillus sp. MY03]